MPRTSLTGSSALARLVAAATVFAALAFAAVTLFAPEATGTSSTAPRPSGTAEAANLAGAPFAGEAVRADALRTERAERPRRAAARARAADRGYLIAAPRAGHSLVVRSRPGGRILARLGGWTQFGSPQTVGVVRREGDWLAVVTTALPNGKLGWIDATSGSVKLSRTRTSLRLDLSRRTLVLWQAGRAVRTMTVGVGRPSSPTPVGRFAVTDKMRGDLYGPYYGCCIVALSAHQPNLPPGWRGGDRVAIHGTNAPSTIGAAASAGCPHASARDMRLLMRRVPLGTPVFVQR